MTDPTFWFAVLILQCFFLKMKLPLFKKIIHTCKIMSMLKSLQKKKSDSCATCVQKLDKITIYWLTFYFHVVVSNFSKNTTSLLSDESVFLETWVNSLRLRHFLSNKYNFIFANTMFLHCFSSILYCVALILLQCVILSRLHLPSQTQITVCAFCAMFWSGMTTNRHDVPSSRRYPANVFCCLLF